MKRVLQLIFPLLAALLPFCAAQAQNLTRVEQILALPAEDAGKNPLPVRIAGTVVDVSTASKSFSLHDGSQTVGVSFPGVTVFPAVGDTVEILGVTRTHTIAGFRFPRVEAQSLHITGHAALPPAQALPTHEVNSTRHFDQWVAFEGHVLRWKYRKTDNEIVITLGDATGFTTVSVRTRGIEDVPKGLLGAKLRLTGVNFSTNTHGPFGCMMIPSVQQVEILSTTGDDPFDQPVTRMEHIATGKAKPGTRLKVRGVVLACLEKNLVYLRDGRFAQANLLFRPWVNNFPYEEYHHAGPWPELKPGDEVEMVGTLMDTTHDPMLLGFALNYCHVRIVGSQPQPDPLSVTLPEVAAGAHTHNLVQLQARLLSLHQLPVDRTSWRTTMMVEAGGKKLPLTHLAPGRASFDTLRIDDELLITALVDDPTATDPRQFWLLSAGDVKSLGVSPVVRTRQLWLWGGGGAAILAILFTWIAYLRRTSHLQARINAELKSANDSARESEQRWKLLFEQSPLSVQIFSPDGQTKRFNQAWKNLFRLNDEQGHAFNVITDPDLNASGAVNHIRKAFEGQVVHVPPVPYPIPGDPPETRWIGGVLYPVKNADGQIIEVVTVHNDITESKRAAEALMEINQLLEQRVAERTTELAKAHADLHRALEQERELNELKSRFVTMVSHEFRTPLGIIMSAIELMRHYDERLPKEKREELQQDIFSATRHMAGLMEQVLVLGRVEAGKLGCKRTPCDLDILASKMTDESLSATNRKCPVLWQPEGDLSDAHADEALLRHIFGNLITNAVKYSPEGSQVTFAARREGGDAVFQVIDHGIGIPEEDRARLFEAFHRCGNVGDIPGTGLGLVIVKRCVDLHGGSLHIDSTIGKGTTFTVRLPLFAHEIASLHG